MLPHCLKLDMLYSFAFAFVNSTLFVQDPTPSRLTSTTSPSFSQTCGFLPIPTPCGLIHNQHNPKTIDGMRQNLRSSKDQIPGQKRRPLTQKSNRLRYPKNHILRRRILHRLPIQLRHNP